MFYQVIFETEKLFVGKSNHQRPHSINFIFLIPINSVNFLFDNPSPPSPEPIIYLFENLSNFGVEKFTVFRKYQGKSENTGDEIS